MLALHSFGLGRLLGGGFLNMSNGTSSTTGPGRPVTMVFHAWRTASGTMLAAGRLEHALAIGAHGRGEVGLVVAVELLEGAAIELARRHVAGHREERHRIRDRQLPSAIGRLAEPGPQEVKVAVGWPDTR